MKYRKTSVDAAPRRWSFSCFKRLLIVFLFALALPASAKENRPGIFDYYVLALSWSPTYCATTGDARGDEQCAPRRNYAFVVHGLWPQFMQETYHMRPMGCRLRDLRHAYFRQTRHGDRTGRAQTQQTPGHLLRLTRQSAWHRYCNTA